MLSHLYSGAISYPEWLKEITEINSRLARRPPDQVEPWTLEDAGSYMIKCRDLGLPGDPGAESDAEETLADTLESTEQREGTYGGEAEGVREDGNGGSMDVDAGRATGVESLDGGSSDYAGTGGGGAVAVCEEEKEPEGEKAGEHIHGS